MTELEKAEKIREKANVSFAEAKEALENSNGDLLDAMIWLENKGKATMPAGGGYFSGADIPAQNTSLTSANTATGNSDGGSGEEFADLMKRFGLFCLKMFNKGLHNHLEATKRDQHLFSCPVIIVILLTLFFPYFVIPAFIISLFFGFRYRFSGDDLGNDTINSVMDGASGVAEDVKKTFVESVNKSDNNNNQ